MKTITLEVPDPIALKIEKMTPQEKKAMTEAINQLISNRKSLEDIMHEASEQARSNGLTPEILEDLLKNQ
jgi:meiotically up-regulated gene 157 (Mug157) protein